MPSDGDYLLYVPYHTTTTTTTNNRRHGAAAAAREQAGHRASCVKCVCTAASADCCLKAGSRHGAAVPLDPLLMEGACVVHLNQYTHPPQCAAPTSDPLIHAHIATAQVLMPVMVPVAAWLLVSSVILLLSYLAARKRRKRLLNNVPTVRTLAHSSLVGTQGPSTPYLHTPHPTKPTHTALLLGAPAQPPRLVAPPALEPADV